MGQEVGGGGSGAVLVVGGGIAGMVAAMHLAELGHEVHLLDSGPAIGGSMHLLDHTFPTDSCGICLMLPRQPAFCPTLECDVQERVHLVPYAELAGLEGEGGAFRARVRHKARYVSKACTGCGVCGAVCPEGRPHDHEGWLSPGKAIYRPAGLRAVPDRWVIDMGYCTRCGACEEACPEGAIDLGMGEREEEIEVGAVLLTPGYTAFNARVKGEYGYGVYKNVVTALEFERQVSLAGSSVGRLRRPSDGGTPGRVAFIQCVGSRDPRCGVGYCSAVCCMYTAKQVARAKGVEPGLEVTVYHMDVRAMGKGYEEYMEGVQGQAGVRYVRAMPSSVHQVEQTGELVIGYIGEGGEVAEERYDVVVLAVGLGPAEGMREIAREVGVELNGYGFAVTEGSGSAGTAREGVYVGGAYREPKDIPDTVVEAEGAAAEVAAYLRGMVGEGARAREEEGRVYREVAEEEPRVGVIVCGCEGELEAIEPRELVAWAGEQRGVVKAEVVREGCSAEGRAAIGEMIVAEGLNRVVVAGCTPRRYRDEFEGMMASVGLDPRLLVRVNLLEQVVYAHGGKGEGVARKARALVGMAVEGMRAMRGLGALAERGKEALVRRAVVVGGGAAGMSAALGLARLGVAVELVEREGELGGQWRQIRYQVDGSDVRGALEQIMREVEGEEGIRVHLRGELKGMEGKPGQYRSVIGVNGREEEVEHGVLVVATGGKEAGVREYLYGEHAGVVTQRELERRLWAEGVGGLERVVMIQCVGSREAGRPYCSRVCCTQAVKNALKLKALRPEVEVYVLYREVRTYGFREGYYEAAREAGVVFVRYERGRKPEVREEGEGLRVRFREPITGQEVEVGAGLVVLSVGIEAEEGEELAGKLGVELGGDGFYREEQAKMKPLDTGRGGVYVAGLAHSPRFLEEAREQGQGAAMRAAAYLAEGERGERGTSVWVNERLCSFCGLCEGACPYEARVMNYERRVAEVEYGLCQGCGVCAMVCPNKATLQKAFEHGQLTATIDMAVNDLMGV